MPKFDEMLFIGNGQMEVGCPDKRGRPSYKWVPAWQQRIPGGQLLHPPMRYADAKALAEREGKEAVFMRETDVRVPRDFDARVLDLTMRTVNNPDRFKWEYMRLLEQAVLRLGGDKFMKGINRARTFRGDGS